MSAELDRFFAASPFVAQATAELHALLIASRESSRWLHLPALPQLPPQAADPVAFWDPAGGPDRYGVVPWALRWLDLAFAALATALSLSTHGATLPLSRVSDRFITGGRLWIAMLGCNSGSSWGLPLEEPEADPVIYQVMAGEGDSTQLRLSAFVASLSPRS